MLGAAPSRIDTRRAHARSAILAAAWELCREQGLAGLSLRDLAARMDMRAPSLYSYFASKDAIYDAMFAEGQRQFAEVIAGMPRTEGRRTDFRTMAHTFFAFCTSDPARYQLMFQRTIPGFEPTPEAYGLAETNLARLVGFLADAGIDDPRHVDLWTAVITGLTDQQISNDPGGDRWAQLLDEVVDLMCDHLGIHD
jgi:AcrR family transcriptional regulator